jgi:hypothetical protein
VLRAFPLGTILYVNSLLLGQLRQKVVRGAPVRCRNRSQQNHRHAVSPWTGREIWCQGSREFARLRPSLVIHRLLANRSRFSVVKKFTRLRATSPDFDQFRVFAIDIHLQIRGLQFNKRITKTRKDENTKKESRLRPSNRERHTDQSAHVDDCGGDPFLVHFQDIKDQLSSRTKPGPAPSFEVPVPLLFGHNAKNITCVYVACQPKNKECFLTFGRYAWKKLFLAAMPM